MRLDHAFTRQILLAPAMAVALLSLGCATEDSGALGTAPEALVRTLEGAAPEPFEHRDVSDLLARVSAAAPRTTASSPVLPPSPIRIRTGPDGHLTSAAGHDLAIDLAPTTGASAEETSNAFIIRWGAAFGYDPTTTTLRAQPSRTYRSFDTVSYQQYSLDGLPVFEREIRINVADAGRVTRARGRLWSGHGLYGNPRSALSSATIRASLPASADRISDPVLGVYVLDESGEAELAWRVNYADISGNELVEYISARDASLLLSRPSNPTLYDIAVRRHTSGIPPSIVSELVYDETQVPDFFLGSWPGTSYQVAVGTSYSRYYMDWILGRDGWSNGTSTSPFDYMGALSDYIPYGSTTQAEWGRDLWSGESVYHRVRLATNAACTDIIAHEWFHGVQDTEYDGVFSSIHARALHESISDVFGSYVESFGTGSPTNDWIMGTGPNCTNLRDLSHPESPSCPTGTCATGTGHYLNFQDDAAHVYPDSQILTKFIQLFSRDPFEGSVLYGGGTVPPGIGRAAAEQLVYDVVMTELGTADGTLTSAAYDIVLEAAYSLSTTQAEAVMRSAFATGFWLEGATIAPTIATDARLAVHRFTVSGSPRTFLFYKAPAEVTGWSKIYYREMNCTLWPNCTPSASILLDWAGDGAGVTTHDGSMYVFYKYDISDEIHYRSMDSSGVWSSYNTMPSWVHAVGPVAAESRGGNLLVYYTDPTYSSRVSYAARIGTTWSGPYRTSVYAYLGSGPSVANVNGTSYLVYNQAGTVHALSSTTPFAWSATGISFGPISGSPSAVSHRDRLDVIHRGTNGQMRYASHCPGFCGYRPGETSQVVTIGYSAAPPLLYVDPGGYWGETLYAISSSGSALSWDFKIGE
jgi:hypothetical protein